MDFEIKSTGLGYILHNSEGSLKVESIQSTVTGVEGNDIVTRTDVLLVVTRAIFYKRHLPYLSKHRRR